MLLPPEREAKYPNLRKEGYGVSSKTTEDKILKYNCVALAARDLGIWWEPSTMNSRPVVRPGRFWPVGIPTDDYVWTYRKLYERLGYKECSTPKAELLYEKIALYADPDETFTHVAYQLYFGWISKLGDWQDIKHKTLKALEDEYGTAKVFMKRRCDARGFLARAFFNWAAKRWPMDRTSIQHPP
jgi:hypothetical protein